MIQRIQTVYLTLAGIGGVTQFFFPFIYSNSPTTLQEIAPFVALMLGIEAFVIIFLHKNRDIQLVLTTVASVLSLTLMGFGWWTIQNIVEGEAIGIAYYIWLSLPIGFWMARKGILKDIKLVKSMDKFR